MICYNFVMSNILDSLNKEQREAVTTIDGPILIIAGAGSGKTKALTHKIAYLIEQGISPENILALTFTNKAAGEMKNRINKLLTNNYPLPTFVGTFHSFAARILRREIDNIGYGKNFVIYDVSDVLSLLKEIVAELGLDPDQFKANGIYSAISRQKNELVNATIYAEKAGNFREKIIAKVFEKYEARLKEANALDFDDLLLLLVKVLKNNPVILEKYQNQFKYVLVDEYQDTNHAQYTLLKMLAQKHKNICVVGDDWQSIYLFRGSDFRNMLNFEKDYPGTKIIFLEENYRSSQNVLDAAHAVIAKNVFKTEKKLWTERGGGEKIKIIQTSNETEEGIFVTEEIKKILRTQSEIARDLNDFVVLYRTNAQSRAIEEAVIRAGWPYRMVGAIKFYERREVKDIIAYLRFIQNEKDLISLKRIVNVPPRGIGKTTLNQILLAEHIYVFKHTKFEGFLNLINEIKNESANKKVSELIKFLLEKIDYKKYCLDGTAEGESRWENILELITVVTKFDVLETPDGLSSFLEEITLTTSADDISEENGTLNLMTLHSAKGLEFPVVFIIGAEEGLLPHARSMFDQTQMEEERRLAYVGLTRAKEKAYFVFTRRRSIYGKSEPALPSRFLGDIPVRLVEFEEYQAGEEVLDI
ncbi:MAG: UvrD-helicase domain-containing protein [bacterium]|nr:UvrD-helicase domain-containing protein [bacterium]